MHPLIPSDTCLFHLSGRGCFQVGAKPHFGKGLMADVGGPLKRVEHGLKELTAMPTPTFETFHRNGLGAYQAPKADA